MFAVQFQKNHLSFFRLRFDTNDFFIFIKTIGDLVHRPVAANSNNELRAVFYGGAGELDGVERLFSKLVLEFLEKVPDTLSDVAPALARPAFGRLRIYDNLCFEAFQDCGGGGGKACGGPGAP